MGAVGGKHEGILGLGSALLACRIKTQGVVDHEIIHGGTVTVGNGSLIEKEVVILDRFLLQDFMMRQGLLELLVDFRENPGQVPSGDVVPGSFRSSRPLGEAPAVALEVLPVPVGKDRVEHGLKFLGGFGHLRLHAGDLLLGLVSLNGSLQVYLLGNGPDGHRMGFFPLGPLDQGIELFDGRLGQALLDCLLNFLPLVD